MEAPQSPSNNPSPLYAIAKLGRSKDVQQAKITSTKLGYAISTDLKGTSVVDTNVVKEIIMQLPDLLKSGKITRKFYEDVRAGVNKLTFSHPSEKEAVQFIAQQVFTKNASGFEKNEQEIEDNDAAYQVVKTLQDVRKSGSTESVKNVERIAIIDEDSYQQKAIDLVCKLVSPKRQSSILRELQNLWIIQTPQDLEIFKKYVDVLIKTRDEGAELIRTGQYVLDATTMLLPAELVLHEIYAETIFSKPSSVMSDKDQQYFITHLPVLQEQACMRNLQVMQDFFKGSFNEELATSKRAIIRQESMKASLEDQKKREANNEPPQPDDFTPIEKSLVEQDFEKRGSGFDFWQKVEWENKVEIPLDEKRAIFVEGTMVFTCAVAIPDGEKQSGRIKLDLKNLGELNYQQIEDVMLYIEKALFDPKAPPIPKSLEFLSKRDAKGLELSPIFGLFVTSAKQELEKMVKEKRGELEQMMGETFFKTNHPEISV